MHLSPEAMIMITAAIITLLLLIFAVDWRYFGDWVVVFLFKSTLSLLAGSLVVEKNLVQYPVRLAAPFFDTSLLFEIWVFPTLCVLYNQITRRRGLWPILYYAVLFSALITALEIPLERYTELIEYITWDWYYTFFSMTCTLLASRLFIAFYRWGCAYFKVY